MSRDGDVGWRLPARLRRVVWTMPVTGRLLLRYRWASLRRIDPISEWGFERGTPVDRWYIERFLERHKHLVHGRVLEVKEDLYATRLGAREVDILDIDPSNPAATIVGDLGSAATLPARRFDVAIVTQTLQLLADPANAVVHLVETLVPGGALLVTVPSVSRLAGEWDRWRWTPAGLRQLLAGTSPVIEVAGTGNTLGCRAFLMGLAAEDLDPRLLAEDEPACPLLITAVLIRQG
jgi:SAM-dependent methyltransferase